MYLFDAFIGYSSGGPRRVLLQAPVPEGDSFAKLLLLQTTFLAYLHATRSAG